LGVKTFLVKPASQASISDGFGLVRAYVSTFSLTITNPLTILSFTAIFAGLGLGSLNRNYFSVAMLISGVFTGSALWWLILSTGIGMFRGKFTPSGLRWVNRVSGVIITGFGIYALLSLI
jgi:threonine/homoserine/homoserine lactone efflux protein